MYRVVELFHDLQDKRYCYKPGDPYPREGIKVTKKRIAELASTNNKRGIVLIEKVKDDQKEQLETEVQEEQETENPEE